MISDEMDYDPPVCSMCGGELQVLGTLGSLVHLSCRDCGMQSSISADDIDIDLG